MFRRQEKKLSFFKRYEASKNKVVFFQKGKKLIFWEIIFKMFEKQERKLFYDWKLSNLLNIKFWEMYPRLNKTKVTSQNMERIRIFLMT